MKTISIQSKQLQEMLGATNPIETQCFWNDESERVFFCDGDKDTCVNELLDEMGTVDGYKLYYVVDDAMFYIIEDFM